MDTLNTDISDADLTGDDWLKVVRRNISNLKFGSVQITVHDGRVTQVESVEKTRFTTARTTKPGLSPTSA